MFFMVPDAAACWGACSDTLGEAFSRMIPYGFLWLLIVWMVKSGFYRGTVSHLQAFKILLVQFFVVALFFAVFAILPKEYGPAAFSPVLLGFGVNKGTVPNWIPIAITISTALFCLFLIATSEWLLLKKSVEQKNIRFMKALVILANIILMLLLPWIAVHMRPSIFD